MCSLTEKQVKRLLTLHGINLVETPAGYVFFLAQGLWWSAPTKTWAVDYWSYAIPFVEIDVEEACVKSWARAGCPEPRVIG